MARRIALLLTLPLLVTFSLAAPSYAKRRMPPKTKICNKTKHKQYVATINYAGRGRYRTSGWQFIKPGACGSFQDDAFHFRGSNKKVTGVNAARTRVSCVTNAKVFSFISGAGTAPDMDAKTCAASNGKLVTFYRARPAARTLTIEK